MRRVLIGCGLALTLLIAAAPAMAQSVSRYDELVASRAHWQTLRSLMIGFLAARQETDQVLAQMQPYFWTRQPGVDRDEPERQMEESRLRGEIAEIGKMAERHDLTQLAFIGFTQGGSLQDLDLYFSGHGVRGPVAIRASVYFPKQDQPAMYGFETFEGWDEVRQAVQHVEHKAGKTTVRVTYPASKEDGERAEPTPLEPEPEPEPREVDVNEPKGASDQEPAGPPPAPRS